MRINKLMVIMFLLIFCFVTSYHLFPRPTDCPQCWQKFKDSLIKIVLMVEKGETGIHQISLQNLRAELEKARIGDQVIVELILGNQKAIEIGTFTPKVIQTETRILEKYNSMGKVSYRPPKGLKLMPTSAQLIVRDVTGRFKSTKYVQLEINILIQ